MKNNTMNSTLMAIRIGQEVTKAWNAMDITTRRRYLHTLAEFDRTGNLDLAEEIISAAN